MSSLALCIPAYNAAAYLPRLLTSAINQQVPFDEILVYDDCSTDNTAEIAAQLGARVIRGDVNRGCSYGKNALAASTGCDWIHFHDADDDLLPNFGALVHDWIDQPNNQFEVLLLNFNYIDYNTGQILGSANHNVNELHADALKYAINNKIVNFGVYKRDAFLKAGGFDLDDNVLYNEDSAFHQRLARLKYKFDYLPDITCINYRYSVSMSASNRLKCARANYHVLEKTAATHGDKYPTDLSRQLWHCINILASCKDWAYVRKALHKIKELNGNATAEGGSLFKLLVKVNSFFAVWIRENLLRMLKPSLRNNG